MVEDDKIKKRIDLLSHSWYQQIGELFDKEGMKNIGNTIKQRKEFIQVHPSNDKIFRAFRLTPYDKIKVCIVGTEPYNGGEADGLAFSNDSLDHATPYMLDKIFNEVYRQVDPYSFPPYIDDLTGWAEKGIFLFNVILSVEHKRPLSHAEIGWKRFAIFVIKALNNHPEPLVFLLWGNQAKELKRFINDPKHLIIEAEEPSSSKFYGKPWECGNCFIKTNEFLERNKKEKIDWSNSDQL